MKKVALIVLLLAYLEANSQITQLSDVAKISIITCAPGEEEVFMAFGHSAIRVSDPMNRIDYAYNYGVFDFNQPNFYPNFTRGLLLYQLGVYEFSDFVNAYLSDGRWVHEQTLNLSTSQQQLLFNYLENNARPENRIYRYDYFYNNCSIKIRDVFAEVLGDSIKFDSSHITTDYTIRQLTDLYLTHQPWGDLGIDICLGLPMDKKASPYEYMFLPDYLESGFDHATIFKNGGWLPAVKSKRIYDPPQQQIIPKSLIHPWVAFGFLFVAAAGLSIRDLKRKKISKWFDLSLFTLTGVLGFLLITLWTATDHEAAAKNFNILWALPTNILVVIIYSNRFETFLKKYFSFVTLIYTVLLISWFFLPQQLHIFLLPMVAALLLRAYTLSRLL